MTADVELRPGLTPLIHWRTIYRGGALALDPFARPDVEAGAAALAEILARGAPQTPSEDGAPTLAELMELGGDRLPSPLVRLFVALKLASLAQGMSGMRWKTLRGISDFLAAGLLPAIPAEGASDRLALASLFAALAGTGEVVRGQKRLPAEKALKKAELSPLSLSPEERSALLSGVELSTAAALAGLFEAERIFQSALVAAALSAAAMHCPIAPLHPRVHRLNRQPGQIEVAAAVRALAMPAEPGGAEASAERGADDGGTRRAPLRMGACLDLLRQAGATLERAANAVTEERLVFWQSGEIVAGVEDRSSIARAADLIALSLATMCDLSLARIAALSSASNPDAGSDADRASPENRAAGFVGRIREHRESGAGPRRLLPMAGTAALVLAIEFLEAMRGVASDDVHIGAPLRAVLAELGEAAPTATGSDMDVGGGLAAIAERVGSGALAAAADVPLPGVVARPQREKSRR